LHYKDRKLYEITFLDLNTAGVFGCPFTVKWNPDDDNLPKKSTRLWLKIDNASINALKETIPDDRHQWIGLID
jgi:hypothetical protein